MRMSKNIIRILFFVLVFFVTAGIARADYDSVLMGTNGGPDYRLEFDNNITESVSSQNTSGAPSPAKSRSFSVIGVRPPFWVNSPPIS